MQVHKYLDLSTAHLTPATRAWLDALDWETEGPSGGPHPYGWNLYAHDDNTVSNAAGKTPMPAGTPEGQYPADLWACFEKARELGCTRVHFDTDGEPSDALPCYDDLGNLIRAEDLAA